MSSDKQGQGIESQNPLERIEERAHLIIADALRRNDVQWEANPPLRYTDPKTNVTYIVDPRNKSGLYRDPEDYEAIQHCENGQLVEEIKSGWIHVPISEEDRSITPQISIPIIQEFPPNSISS